MPATDTELAFLPLAHLARLVETRQVKPSELTDLYLARLKRYDPILHCVVSFTEELARPWQSGPEIQVQDNIDGHDPQKSGWLYQLYRPVKPDWARRFENQVGCLRILLRAAPPPPHGLHMTCECSRSHAI